MLTKTRVVASTALALMAGTCAAASVDLSVVDFASPTNLKTTMPFSGASAITYDFVYPAGNPAATVEISLIETQEGAVRDIQWTSAAIIGGGQTTTADLSNGQTCGPNLLITRLLSGGGTLVARDTEAMTLTVTQMPLAPTLSIVLSGRAVGTGNAAGHKGSYVLSVKRVPVP